MDFEDPYRKSRLLAESICGFRKVSRSLRYDGQTLTIEIQGEGFAFAHDDVKPKVGFCRNADPLTRRTGLWWAARGPDVAHPLCFTRKLQDLSGILVPYTMFSSSGNTAASDC